ncbi:MAG: fructose-bisphosphatase class III, partial [Lachnospiraceae bacterium]|nr:fructose-bisphosphatase class III [Lachnospiraceae bacterium]
RIFEDFGLDPKTSHIVNGHMPVDANRGESPIRCHGRVLIIDGGFSKPYHEKTHLAGYTLVYNSWGLRLMAHQPFTSAEDAIREDSDVHSDGVWIERKGHRIAVADTDNGRRMQEQIEDLRELLEAYRSGAIREKVK